MFSLLKKTRKTALYGLLLILAFSSVMLTVNAQMLPEETPTPKQAKTELAVATPPDIPSDPFARQWQRFMGEHSPYRPIILSIINYTLEQRYMLDEVPVRLPFDCDWDEAKRLMLETAKEETGELVTESGVEPFVRVELLDWGLLARLRYNTIPANRQETSSRVIESLLRKFKESYPRVRFAIPSSTVHYRSGNEPESSGETDFPPTNQP